jgi:hypothetical protein
MEKVFDGFKMCPAPTQKAEIPAQDAKPDTFGESLITGTFKIMNRPFGCGEHAWARMGNSPNFTGRVEAERWLGERLTPGFEYMVVPN